MKHLVATVVNKRRKEPNYGQELAFQSKHITTTKLVGMVVGPNGKLKIHFISRHTGAGSTLTSSRTSHSVLGFKELESTTHLFVI